MKNGLYRGGHMNAIQKEAGEFVRSNGHYCEEFSAWILPKMCRHIQARMKQNRVFTYKGRREKEYSNYDPCIGCPHDTREGGHRDKRVKSPGWKRLQFR